MMRPMKNEAPTLPFSGQPEGPRRRVLLADDLDAVRSALALLLEHEVDLRVSGQVPDAASLLQAVADDPPDLVLLDWELPGMPADKLVGELRRSHPAVSIVALSSRPEAENAAMQAGVDAFINKGNPPDTVLQTLEHLGPRQLSEDEL